MAKYIITQDEPTWLRCRYEVEAESEEDAERMLFDVCRYEYLGHEVKDRVDPFDNAVVSVERVDDPPNQHVDMLSHGWDVFDVDGTGRMEIQRVDDPVKQKRDVDRVFKTDAEAIAHVVMLADRGNPACRQAVQKVVQSWNLDGSKTVPAYHWGEIDAYPSVDWRTEVENNETRLGYRDWVKSQQDKEDLT